MSNLVNSPYRGEKMPTPTALVNRDQDGRPSEVSDRKNQYLLIDTNSAPTAPVALRMTKDIGFDIETRRVLVPPHRVSAFKKTWTQIYPPLVEHLHLQVRFNVKSKAVELRSSNCMKDPDALQKGADFVQAIAYGFDVENAIALLRLDNLYFPITSLTNLEHADRCTDTWRSLRSRMSADSTAII